MEAINYDSITDGEIVKRLKELLIELESVDSKKMATDMNWLMEQLSCRGSDADITVMKKLGSDFETLSVNLFNLAVSIDRKFKTR